MYNGLFGDLPAAASSAGGDEPDPNKKTQPPPEKKAKVAAPKPHLLFVPQQAKRRRGKQQATQKRRAPTVVLPQSTNNVDKQQQQLQSQTESSSTAFESDIIVCRKPTQNIDEEESEKEAQSSSLSETREHTAQHSTRTTAPLNAEPSPTPANNMIDDERYHKAVEEAKEDPYDPMVPNDLLQYRRTQAMAREKRRLLEQRDAAIREQEMMRRSIEEERIQLEKEGNLERIVEHRVQQGMGRGRGGVSNLPAWVVAQQQQDRKHGTSPR